MRSVAPTPSCKTLGDVCLQVGCAACDGGDGRVDGCARGKKEIRRHACQGEGRTPEKVVDRQVILIVNILILFKLLIIFMHSEFNNISRHFLVQF